MEDIGKAVNCLFCGKIIEHNPKLHRKRKYCNRYCSDKGYYIENRRRILENHKVWIKSEAGKKSNRKSCKKYKQTERYKQKAKTYRAKHYEKHRPKTHRRKHGNLNYVRLKGFKSKMVGRYGCMPKEINNLLEEVFKFKEEVKREEVKCSR